jgi:RHS repeat-associated protein
VLDAKDFYPLGLEMPARGYVSGIGAKEGFTSKERDGETGTDYFGARYYMSAIGRWGNMDPLAEQYPASTPYNYVLNNPVRYTDPDGKMPDCPSCKQLYNQYISRSY